MTLGEELERDRLERRALRIEGVLWALRGRARQDRDLAGEIPEALRRAIADFDAELRGIRAALRARPTARSR